MSQSKTTNGNGNAVQPLATSAYAALESIEPARSEGLSQSDRDAMLSLINQMREMLPFLRDLTAEERRALLGMAEKNRAFAGKVLEVILHNPDFLPRSFDIEKFQQELATFDRLSTVLMSLNQLRDLVDATITAIGSEAYEDALTAYRHAKVSGQGASLEGMLAEMGQRFARKPKKKEEEKREAIE